MGRGEGTLGAHPLGGASGIPTPPGFRALLKPDGKTYILKPDGVTYMLGPMLPSTRKSAIVNADLTSVGATIPADFVGFSTEVDDLIAGNYQGTTGSAGSFIGCASLLGSSGRFRNGGSSANTPASPPVTQPIANGLASFASGLGPNWSVLFGLDLQANDAAAAATQAGYLNNALGSKVTFQMGNEPFTGGAYTTSTFPPAWNAYYSAITSAVPSARFAACDDNNQGLTQTAIGSLTPGLAGLSAVTLHYYSFTGSSYTPVGDYRDWLYLLSQIATDPFFSIIYPFTNGGGKPLIMSEINSISFGGLTGMSDRMMSQTWFLKVAIHLAKIGYAGMCLHTTYDGQPGRYNPLAKNANGNFTPRPLFYGMVLFSKIAGKPIVASTQGGTAFIESIAVKEASGNASLLVSNNDPLNTAYISPRQSAPWRTAAVLLSCDSDGQGALASAMTLGGQAIGESGAWSGTTFTINNGDVVAIPPCGAAHIQFQT